MLITARLHFVSLKICFTSFQYEFGVLTFCELENNSASVNEQQDIFTSTSKQNNMTSERLGISNWKLKKLAGDDTNS